MSFDINNYFLRLLGKPDKKKENYCTVIKFVLTKDKEAVCTSTKTKERA